MVTFIKDKVHVAGQHTVFLVILKDDTVEINLNLHCGTRFNVFHRQTLKLLTEELYMVFINQMPFEGVASAFFLHDMDIERFYQQSYFTSGLKAIVVLYHQFVTVFGLHQHFVVYTFENATCHCTLQLGCI